MSSRGNVLHSSFNIAYDSIHMQWRRNEFESGGGGAPIRRKVPEKKNFWSFPLHFLALKEQLIVLVSAFVTVSTVWSVSCWLFFYSRFPRVQPFVKVGRGHVPPCPMESVPLYTVGIKYSPHSSTSTGRHVVSCRHSNSTSLTRHVRYDSTFSNCINRVENTA